MPFAKCVIKSPYPSIMMLGNWSNTIAGSKKGILKESFLAMQKNRVQQRRCHIAPNGGTPRVEPKDGFRRMLLSAFGGSHPCIRPTRAKQKTKFLKKLVRWANGFIVCPRGKKPQLRANGGQAKTLAHRTRLLAKVLSYAKNY